MSKPREEETVKFVLRIPPKLHESIKKGAKKNNTSMNKHIVNQLITKELLKDIDLKIIKADVARILQIVEGYDFSG